MKWLKYWKWVAKVDWVCRGGTYGTQIVGDLVGRQLQCTERRYLFVTRMQRQKLDSETRFGSESAALT